MTDRETSVRNLAIKTLLSILGIGVVVGILGAIFESQIIETSSWLSHQLGIAGILMAVFLTDAFITGIPPDLFLIVILKSELKDQWPVLVSLIGISSTIAGCTGWFIGTKLGHLKWAEKHYGPLIAKNRKIIDRYGPWGVAIGALTPIPFSFTCWLAGALEIRFKIFFWMAALRIPRFLFYYMIIMSSETLF